MEESDHNVTTDAAFVIARLYYRNSLSVGIYDEFLVQLIQINEARLASIKEEKEEEKERKKERKKDGKKERRKENERKERRRNDSKKEKKEKRQTDHICSKLVAR